MAHELVSGAVSNTHDSQLLSPYSCPRPGSARSDTKGLRLRIGPRLRAVHDPRLLCSECRVAAVQVVVCNANGAVWLDGLHRPEWADAVRFNRYSLHDHP